MDRHYIHYLLKKNGTNGAEIARKLKVSKAAVYRTIYGDLKSARIRRAVARAAGIKPAEIWPPK